ncbi:MAG: hypothetical protein ACXW2E_00700 [Nitrososphaeraceae archaeon]
METLTLIAAIIAGYAINVARIHGINKQVKLLEDRVRLLENHIDEVEDNGWDKK